MDNNKILLKSNSKKVLFWYEKFFLIFLFQKINSINIFVRDQRKMFHKTVYGEDKLSKRSNT